MDIEFKPAPDYGQKLRRQPATDRDAKTRKGRKGKLKKSRQGAPASRGPPLLPSQPPERKPKPQPLRPQARRPWPWPPQHWRPTNRAEQRNGIQTMSSKKPTSAPQSPPGAITQAHLSPNTEAICSTLACAATLCDAAAARLAAASAPVTATTCGAAGSMGVSAAAGGDAGASSVLSSSRSSSKWRSPSIEGPAACCRRKEKNESRSEQRQTDKIYE